jgi:hypothetical protein
MYSTDFSNQRLEFFVAVTGEIKLPHVPEVLHRESLDPRKLDAQIGRKPLPYLRSSFSGTQSPGALSYFQKVQPLQVALLHAAAATKEGDLYTFPLKRINPSLLTRAIRVFPLNMARKFIGAVM